MKITKDLKNLLLEYVIEHPMKFKKFIDKNKINWSYLSSNTSPAAIRLIEKNINSKQINLYYLSSNPAAVKLLEKNMDKIVWERLSSNPSPDAIDLIEKNIDVIEHSDSYMNEYRDDVINWMNLSKNTCPKVIPLLEKNLDKVPWYFLYGNPNAIELIEQKIDSIFLQTPMNEEDDDYIVGSDSDDDWSNLSLNEAAIHLIEKYQHHTKLNGQIDRTNWNYLSQNPKAIPLLEQNPDMINWKTLSNNSGAINIIEKNLDKINWDYLSFNPSAIYLLEKNLMLSRAGHEDEKINWDCLSKNPSPRAIKLLEQNTDKINWEVLAGNPNGLHLIEQKMNSCEDDDKFYWNNLGFGLSDVSKIFTNPKIFELDIKKQKK